MGILTIHVWQIFCLILAKGKLSVISEERDMCVSACAYFMLVICVYILISSKHVRKHMHLQFYMILLQNDTMGFLKE